MARLETPTTKGGALCQGTPDASEVSRKRRRRDIFVAHVTTHSEAPSGATSLEYVAPDGACGIGLRGVLQRCRAYGAEGRNQLLTHLRLEVPWKPAEPSAFNQHTQTHWRTRAPGNTPPRQPRFPWF